VLGYEPAASERARVIALLSSAPASIDDLIRLSSTSPRVRTHGAAGA
jgi:hypothetical protein